MWWKRLALGALVVLLVYSNFCEASSESMIRWKKYVTANGSVSFYHPEGWVVGENESGFVVHDEGTYEQLWLVVLPYEETWTAQDHAEFFLGLIQEENPEIQASNWELDASEDVVFFYLRHGTGQTRADGYGLVIKDKPYEQALWFHYLAPGDMFNEDRGLAILEGFVNSLASGPDATPPAGSADARMARIDRNVDGFLFILEFALGSPLSLAEETMIASELKGVMMEYSDEELAGFDEYPSFGQFIMTLSDQNELAEIRETLAESVWGWVEESDPDDPIVNLIRDAMLEADRILVEGKTPLTEVAAMAYSEFVAFAEHLWENGPSDPAMISDRTVQEIKEQLMEAWGDFSQEEKEQVLDLPAVWATLRRALKNGNEDDREYALRVIRSSVPQNVSTGDSPASPEGEQEPMSWVQHNAMLAIQQQTFNYYMWSVGYHKTIYGF